MPDLSNINPAQPPDTEAVALGASRMREMRVATQTSMDEEHTLDGKHQIPGGNNADRAAPDSTDGRIFRNLERRVVEQSIAGIWAVLHAANIQYQYIAGLVSITNGGAWTDLASVTFDSPFGGTVLAVGQAGFYPLDAALMSTRFLLDGTTVLDGGAILATASSGVVTLVPVISFGAFNSGFGLSAGSHTIKLQGSYTAVGGATNVGNRFLGLVIA